MQSSALIVLRVHLLDSLDRRQLRCCGRRDLLKGNFAAQKFTCEACGHNPLHGNWKPASHPPGCLLLKRLRKENIAGFAKQTNSIVNFEMSGDQYLRDNANRLKLPTRDFDLIRRDSRPLSFGVFKPSDSLHHGSLPYLDERSNGLRNRIILVPSVAL